MNMMGIKGQCVQLEGNHWRITVTASKDVLENELEKHGKQLEKTGVLDLRGLLPDGMLELEDGQHRVHALRNLLKWLCPIHTNVGSYGGKQSFMMVLDIIHLPDSELLRFNQATGNLEDSDADIWSKLDNLAMELQDNGRTRPEKAARFWTDVFSRLTDILEQLEQGKPVALTEAAFGKLRALSQEGKSEGRGEALGIFALVCNDKGEYSSDQSKASN
ncbi:hypothetical protein BDD12DRAFT_881065 [Trichophaea hybrida]|nr:hypothetical protein BDD12DRAFT_881065 [Trichophaea hybrida]